MRIGIFTDTYEPDINGVVSSIVTLENALKKLGHDVYVITNHNRLHIEMVGNVLFLPGVELKKLYGYTMSSFYSFKGKKIIENMNLDIIHVHTEFGIGLFARVVSKFLKIPLVSTYHTSYEDYTHYVNFMNSDLIENISKKAVIKLSKFYADSTSAIIAPSEKTKEVLIRYGVKTPVYEIPTGLQLSRFKEVDDGYVARIVQQYEIQNQKVILFVGRIAEEKNVMMLLDAMTYIEDAKLMVVGDGPQLEILKQYVIQIGVQDQVIFTGRKENQFIPQYYAIADCFASASTSETQGMTYIEALAAGKVVFARRDDVVKHLIHEDENGYYFDNAEELANKLQKFFVLEETKKEAMKQAAYTSIEQYDDIVFGRKVEKMYQDVLDEKMMIEDVRFEKNGICLMFEKEQLLVDMDSYLNHHLAKGKQITKQLFDELKQAYESKVAYETVLKKVSRKMYTEKEAIELLHQYGLEDIEECVVRMKENHLINDEAYVEAYLAQNKLQYRSNRFIENALKEKGIEYIVDRDENEIALQYAEKLVKQFPHLSHHQKFEKIRQKLYESFFGFDAIAFALDNLEIEKDEEKEASLRQKTIEKAERLYGKYEGYEKERRIRLYLKTKGFKDEN